MKRIYTCILCPNGCEISVEYEGGELLSAEGNLCPKGLAYVTQEITAPKRTISTSVRVIGGELPVTSVRLTAAVPRERIFDVMREIAKLAVYAPVIAGTVLIRNVLELGSDVIVTKSVEKV